MKARNKRLAVIRGWLHDTLCVSAHCPRGDSDHARTQHRTAVQLEACGDDASALMLALHDALCLPYLRSHTRREERTCEHRQSMPDSPAWSPYAAAVDGLVLRLRQAAA